MFAKGEVVRALMNAQGLVAGELYTIREIHVHSAGPFGDVTYRVQARKQKGPHPILLDIANGHLLLHGFGPRDTKRVLEQEAAERVAAAGPKMLVALKAQHEAIDWLMARLIEADKSFFPSKSPAFPALKLGNEAIAEAEGKLL